ncbi:hypothetical protein HYH03_010524 [Edaphochlamys debaryana]|uniref:Uncharacterized protein n=1 Tax=Edaphochlamys debaryana TaxID=47281 RepID=A0A836BXE3_9CHLO|nr:hypothetical protein HYH03_010524 [Edaphochlamys debaryana]|eukprot:KAG2491079.1 hypothetical protein HYH03_010524 [Edaphochlamys debaryana]
MGSNGELLSLATSRSAPSAIPQRSMSWMLPNADADGSSSAALAPITAVELHAALRRQGLDVRLVQPISCGMAPCGRRSTGGGGHCAAKPGSGSSTCFFCSRQPYVLVAPSSSARKEQGTGCAAAAMAAAALAGSAASGEPVVVETCLRELFRAAPSTPEYAAAVEALPEVWVGPRCELLELAGCMCTALALNFSFQGLDVPPWRRRSNVLARWAERHIRTALAAPTPPPPAPPSEPCACAQCPPPSAPAADGWLPGPRPEQAACPRPSAAPHPPAPAGRQPSSALTLLMRAEAEAARAEAEALRRSFLARKEPARVVVGFALPETARAG